MVEGKMSESNIEQRMVRGECDLSTQLHIISNHTLSKDHQHMDSEYCVAQWLLYSESYVFNDARIDPLLILLWLLLSLLLPIKVNNWAGLCSTEMMLQASVSKYSLSSLHILSKI